MLAHILKSNNVKFAAMIGGESIEFSNYVNNTGVSQIEDLKDCVFLCEACEYKRNLLALDPRVSVVLNAECDHPDCYDNLKSVKATFSKFLQKSSVKIVCENNLELIDKTKKQNSKNSFCVCVENGKEKRIQCFFKADGAIEHGDLTVGNGQRRIQKFLDTSIRLIGPSRNRTILLGTDTPCRKNI